MRHEAAVSTRCLGGYASSRMLYASAVMAGLQRRRWAEAVERRAPERCTVAAAADLAGVERERFLTALRGELGGNLRLDSELSRRQIVAALNRHPPSQAG